MDPAPLGSRIRVVANRGQHNYRLGDTYTVSFIDGDGTLKARDAQGREGNWIRWDECEPAGGIGWEFARKVLAPDAVLFLSVFDNVGSLELKPEVKDKLLLALPDLYERIMEAAQERREAEEEAEEEKEDDDEADDDEF